MSEEKGEEYVKVCPNCGSTDIEIGEESSRKLTDVFGIDSEFKCGNCGFSSYLFPEVPLSKLEEYEGSLEEINPKDDSREKEVGEKTNRGFDRKTFAVSILAVAFSGSIPIAISNFLNPVYGIIIYFVILIGILYFLYNTAFRDSL